MKKFEAGKIYCETNKFSGGRDYGSRIYVHSAGKMLVYSHINKDGKMWGFSESKKDRVKIHSYDDSESIHLHIGICGTEFCAKNELPDIVDVYGGSWAVLGKTDLLTVAEGGLGNKVIIQVRLFREGDAIVAYRVKSGGTLVKLSELKNLTDFRLDTFANLRELEGLLRLQNSLKS